MKNFNKISNNLPYKSIRAIEDPQVNLELKRILKILVKMIKK